MPIEFFAACEGYMEKKEEDAKLLRFASYRVSESMAGTKALGSIERFWPIGEDNSKKKIEPMTKERYEAIIKRHNIKVK